MTTSKTQAIYQFRVELGDVEPPVWRSFQVADNITLAQLHGILQTVMGWEDCHLHEFRIGDAVFSNPFPEDGVDEREIKDERKQRLSGLGLEVGQPFEYVYDFGDDWIHGLWLEAILPPEAGKSYPLCLAGQRSGPPDDVGGAFGYANYLEALEDEDHPEHEELLQWRGPFDPERFSLAKVNRQLWAQFAPKPKPATAPKRRR